MEQLSLWDIGGGWTMFPVDEKLFSLLAQTAGAVALWASARATQNRDEVADLTERLRQPVKWTMRHPVQAVARLKKRPALG